jgi:hypothetical protein
MEIAGVIERVERIAEVRANPVASAETISSGLVAVREIEAWCAARHAGLVAQLRQVDSFPEKTIADAAKTSLGQASKTTERSATLDATPGLGAALGDGAITAGHIDAVTRTSKRLDPAQRDALFERADALANVAAAATVDEFARRLELEAKRLDDIDGNERLQRQRRAARARTWVDAEGMWNLSARLDPLTGVKVAARLDATVEAVFAESVPDGCPQDPIEKQRYLLAQALNRLLTDTTSAASARPGRAEFVAVIDADAQGQPGPVAEFAIPVEIPARVLADLAGDADIHAVVVRNGVVLYAPGELNLGRTTRLANRAQRRALRGLYRCCAIPGCTVAYERCKLHHVIWWRNDGRTDLDNLLPVCSIHHTNIHHDSWVIELGPNRELTLTLPDGNVHTTGPPTRRTAA